MRENWHNMLRKKYFCNLLYYFLGYVYFGKGIKRRKEERY